MGKALASPPDGGGLAERGREWAIGNPCAYKHMSLGGTERCYSKPRKSPYALAGKRVAAPRAGRRRPNSPFRRPSETDANWITKVETIEQKKMA
ncbi:hypothetical protein GCM10007387_59780 [Pseudoduganella albidiflava]|uniref:Uncharacterized protein n=1 Tax=Pseudoduganella albidiflava TaxID=321983 RepID=A0AA88C628_9BURK|nr:hypothetical protein GCM10007387_59780 [Pseudoduganella albidiflava]